MKIRLIWLMLLVLTVFVRQSWAANTLRVDYYHTGNATQELFSLDRVVVEPLPWAGNSKKPIDDTNLGKYYFEVIDRDTNKAIFSRGFASIYGEWETTEEAKNGNRTFHESLRFPTPEKPVQVVLKKRDSNNAFREIWSLIVDPKDMFVDPAQPVNPGKLLEIMKNGDPQNKVDLLVLGDGYTAAEQPKFEKDVRRMTEILFATSPFKEHRQDFNVWALAPPADQSGISRPSTGQHRASPLGCSYDAFGSERYVLTYDNRQFRTIASFAPYDFVEILVNNRTYGGGGIFNLYGTVAADSFWAPYIFVHEFGHHFAGLADEYYTSSTAYLPPANKVEPWEPNVTALLDPKKLKWRDLVTSDTPIPTPWQKEEADKYALEYQKRRNRIRQENRPEDEMDALFQEDKEYNIRTKAQEKYLGKVGAFEGAVYEPQGYYRPEVDCIMFTRSESFCRVCRRAVERVIDLYSK